MNKPYLNALLFGSNGESVGVLLDIKRKTADGFISGVRHIEMNEVLDENQKASETAQSFAHALRAIGFDALKHGEFHSDDPTLEICDWIGDEIQFGNFDSMSSRDYIVLHECARMTDALIASELCGC